MAFKIEATAHRLLKRAGKHIEGEWFSASIDECTEAIARAERIVAGVESDPTPKPCSLNFREGDVLRVALQRLADANKRSLSDYVRIVLEEHADAQRERQGDPAKDHKR
jgi:hypothetical protein